MEFGTMLHRSSVLTKSLDRTLETFTFGNCGSINLVACCEDISFNLCTESIFFCIFKFEFSYISLGCRAGFLEMSLHSLVYAVCVNDFFLSACIFVDDLVFLVNEANLYCAVTVIFNCFNLCYYTRSCLKNGYGNKNTVFVEDLSHSDFCC